jgi:hypothetical protein
VSPTGTIEVAVRARVTRRVRFVMGLLRFARRRLGYRPSPERQEKLVAWLVERCEVEIGPPQVKPSPRP